ncbi:MAG: hypothetical protein AAFX87_14980 [Bacteroidota bacterium]
MPLFLFSLLFFVGHTNAQGNCDCLSELDFTLQELAKTPSYKAQIKGERKQDFEKYVSEIREDIRKDPLIDIHCLVYLQKVVYEVKDNHLGIRPSTPILDENNQTALRQFRASAAFLKTPKSKLNLDSLQQYLKTKTSADIEGIYYSNSGATKLAVYYLDSGRYRGVILNSQSSLWDRGQIKFNMNTDEETALALIYNGMHEGMYFVDRSGKHLLYKWGYKKEGKQNDYFRKRSKLRTSRLKNIKGIPYLYLSSFRGSNENFKILDSLYTFSLPLLGKAKDIIIDVRDNGGGGERTYNRLIKSLESMAKRPKIHVMINRFTGSAAEHFTLEMKRLGATVYGENSLGAINYRYPNKGNKEPASTPCFKYRLFMTTAHNRKQYRNLTLERDGITPDLTLKESEDWIEQLVRIIKQN